MSRQVKMASLLLSCMLWEAAGAPLMAQSGRGPGAGGGAGPGRADVDFVADRDTFHFLLANHAKIRREVKLLPDGVQTLTETDDPALVAKLQEHVAAMYKRVEQRRPIRQRDPLFREIFRHTQQIEMKVEPTDKGVRVIEKSKDKYVVQLIQAHAQVVSKFVAHGFDEAHKNHAVPQPLTTVDAASAVKLPVQDAVTTADDAAAADDAAQRQRAAAAKDELAKRLSTRLVQAMSSGGPACAIEVCSIEAPRIAKQIGEQQGVTMGRTSFRLRNSTNKPPQWTETLVRERVTEPTFVHLPDRRLGALYPIRVNAQCLTCHGPSERLGAEVKAELAARYPDDQAVGFNDGDLRGWFWVEVPASPTR